MQIIVRITINSNIEKIMCVIMNKQIANQNHAKTIVLWD